MLRDFPTYKALIFKQLFEGNPIKTKDAWDNTVKIMDDLAPSRASVINFMQALEESGYANFEEKTGRGGYHRVYSPKISFEEALAKLKDDMLQEFNETVLLNIT